LYQLEDDSGDEMAPEEFFSCIYKTLKAICNIGEIQFPYIETQAIEVFKDEVSRGENINREHFKQVITRECQKFATQLQDTGLYMRTLSTLLVDNPFPVLPFLQKGNLFLGKYEIIAEPVLIDSISSYYKRRYKHALLNAKQMLGNEKLSFELIYLSGLKGDHSFRQNFFREIVLKNKFRKEQVTEFGEIPGGILYKVITEVEATPMTLKEYLEGKTEATAKSYPPNYKRRRLYCMSERDVIELGLQLLEQLETLHTMHVLHSNINPSAVYLVESDIKHLQFLDLELAVWEPLEILGVNSTYFSQYKEDIYDTTFRIEDFIAPEHRELAEEFRRTARAPKQSITPQCDLYSIGALLFQALTGKTLKKVLEQLNTDGEHSEEDVFRSKVMDQLIASSDMLIFLEQILSKDLKVRHADILTVKSHLTAIKEKLDRLPDEMLQGLEHIPADPAMMEESFSLDLRQFEMNEFAQNYLYKYILESNIPNICLFGEKLPLKLLRENRISELILVSSELYAEDLKILSLFLAINTSLTTIDISK
jgi:serine/threonine protein kinase